MIDGISALWKRIFSPLCNAALNFFAYLLLGAVLWLELGSAGFLLGGILVGLFVFGLYTLVLSQYNETTEAQHLAFLIATLAALLLLLVYYGVSVNRSQFALLILALASLVPFYNFCGYARFTRVDGNTSLLKYIAGVLLVPFTAFLIYNRYAGSNYKTVYMIVIVAAYYFVIFSLVKIAVLAVKSGGLGFLKTARIRRVLTLLLSVVMPVTGLLLNQFMYSQTSRYALQTHYTYRSLGDGFFGNFSHPLFYVLTLINVTVLRCSSRSGSSRAGGFRCFICARWASALSCTWLSFFCRCFPSACSLFFSSWVSTLLYLWRCFVVAAKDSPDRFCAAEKILWETAGGRRLCFGLYGAARMLRLGDGLRQSQP